MTSDDRQRLRKLQDKWLKLPTVRHQVEMYGEDHLVFGYYATDGPTFKEVRTQLFPNLESWFRQFFDEAT